MGESRFLFPFFFAGYKSRCDWHANFCPSLDAFGCVPRTCRDSWPKIGALFGNKGEGEGVRRMVRQKDAEPDAFRDRFASWLVPCALLVFALCRFSPAGWMKGRQGISEGCCASGVGFPPPRVSLFLVSSGNGERERITGAGQNYFLSI